MPPSPSNGVIEIAALKRGENRFHLSPDESERRRIAERLGEPGVASLTGDFVLSPVAAGVDLRLHLKAEVNRLCVASLEPMIETVDERYAIRFERDFREDDAAETDDVSKEPLEGDTIDLDEILIQHLSLSLVPHPRKEGARSLAEGYRDPVTLSPFAGLKGIVDGGG
ncbi:MAG: YceD family protein [Parvularculaceae bacterium]